ncbi:MAG: replication-associated recombination protein A [Acidobacteria bacterium]|nr:replication-associated recombination protein A [Acidobacteriota bacterium]
MADPADQDRLPAAPLADRMRPKSLDRVVGQQKLTGADGVLRGFVAARELPSMVLWGPPGSGKTTLARLLAAAIGAEMVSFSAVLSGVKEARAVMAEARRRRQAERRRTVLFVDEIHRFNRAQQDAFLPYVETGDIILLGATTENPSFELNRALLSRLKVYVLDPLADEEVELLLKRALEDKENGLGSIEIEVDGEVLPLIARLSAGDARQALNHLEMACQIAASEQQPRIDRETVEQVAQRTLAIYDKGREEHYNLISALHKAIRNSDLDASLYWLVRMLEGGADPRFIARRLLRVASEDVGMADPRALQQAAAAAHAVEHIGMPECELALAQAAAYLALAPKSNALYTAYGRVKAEVARRPGLPVPLQIRNAPTRLMKEQGYGAGYRYAHDEPGHVADMDCLPPELVGEVFYRPTEEGWEARIRERLKELRERRRRR